MFYFPRVSSLPAGGVGMRVYSACEPALDKLIHSLASIQCSGAACWLMDWRKPVILHWESVLSTHPTRLACKAAEIQRSSIWELEFILEGCCRPRLGLLVAILVVTIGLIQQRQQNSYTQEIGRREGEVMGSSCPTVGKILDQQVFSPERCVWWH